MQPEFREFLSRWQVLALAAGPQGLPTRQQVTASRFHAFLPNMMVARWDTKSWMPTIDYCGTRIDQLMRRDVQQEPVKALLAPGPHMETHLEIAKTVITKEVGAELEAEVALGGGNVIVASQLRLPLAPMDGKPTIISLFSIPDVPPNVAIEGKVSLLQMNHRFIELRSPEFSTVSVGAAQ